MAVVFKPLSRPTSLKPGTNGKLGPTQLVPQYFPGYGWNSLYPTAKRAYEVLAVLVKAETGKTISVTPGGGYRPFLRQEQAFFQRMVTWLGIALATVPWITRTYQKTRYYLKRGYAPVAAPEWYDADTGRWYGGSNHGWGLAVDLSIWNGSQHLSIVSDRAVWAAVTKHAESLGWSWEGVQVPGNWAPGMAWPKGWEPWHLRYVLADVVPQKVKDVENFLKAQAGA